MPATETAKSSTVNHAQNPNTRMMLSWRSNEMRKHMQRGVCMRRPCNALFCEGLCTSLTVMNCIQKVEMSQTQRASGIEWFGRGMLGIHVGTPARRQAPALHVPLQHVRGGVWWWGGWWGGSSSRKVCAWCGWEGGRGQVVGGRQVMVEECIVKGRGGAVYARGAVQRNGCSVHDPDLKLPDRQTKNRPVNVASLVGRRSKTAKFVVMVSGIRRVNKPYNAKTNARVIRQQQYESVWLVWTEWRGIMLSEYVKRHDLNSSIQRAATRGNA